jgi:hypothetical protein
MKGVTTTAGDGAGPASDMGVNMGVAGCAPGAQPTEPSWLVLLRTAYPAAGHAIRWSETSYHDA